MCVPSAPTVIQKKNCFPFGKQNVAFSRERVDPGCTRRARPQDQERFGPRSRVRRFGFRRWRQRPPSPHHDRGHPEDVVQRERRTTTPSDSGNRHRDYRGRARPCSSRLLFRICRAVCRAVISLTQPMRPSLGRLEQHLEEAARVAYEALPPSPGEDCISLASLQKLQLQYF